MGNMVEISILTDGFDQVEKYPKQFVQLINRAMQASPLEGRFHYAVGNHANVATIYPFHHSSERKVYLADRNLFVELSEYGVEQYLRGTNPVDHSLDFIEDEVDSAIRMLSDAKTYVRYLREEVGYDYRPGQPENKFGHHHGEAMRWGRKRGNR